MLRSVLVAVMVLVTTTTAIPAIAGGPIVDMRGVDPVVYNRDLAECGDYADQVGVGQQAATGAVAGAVLGGAIGAVVKHHGVGEGAGAGAIIGGAKGVGSGLRERRTVVHNCLRNRGYAVLN
jgi:outer membrane lipoprotein SlyB